VCPAWFEQMLVSLCWAEHRISHRDVVDSTQTGCDWQRDRLQANMIHKQGKTQDTTCGLNPRPHGSEPCALLVELDGLL